jgi:hypothetical protein
MASIITLQNLQEWVKFPSAGASAAAILSDGATPIVSVTATELGTWANAVQWTVTHGLVLTWSLRLEGMGMVQKFEGFDTSLGLENTEFVQPTTTYRGQPDPQPAWVTVAKLFNGRPDQAAGALTRGVNVRGGLDLSALARNADALVDAGPTFYERNTRVSGVVRGRLAPGASWADLDQSERADFLSALLAAIDD